MTVIKVTNELPIYEIGGKAPAMHDTPVLIVRSHWNDPLRIVLETETGYCITINAKDLRAAIENAANTRRF